MKHDRVKAEQRRMLTATRRVNRAQKAVSMTRKRIVEAKRAQKVAAKQ